MNLFLSARKETFLTWDKGTTGRPVTDYPGTSRGTSSPLETLVLDKVISSQLLFVKMF